MKSFIFFLLILSGFESCKLSPTRQAEKAAAMFCDCMANEKVESESQSVNKCDSLVYDNFRYHRIYLDSLLRDSISVVFFESKDTIMLFEKVYQRKIDDCYFSTPEKVKKYRDSLFNRKL